MFSSIKKIIANEQVWQTFMTLTGKHYPIFEFPERFVPFLFKNLCSFSGILKFLVKWLSGTLSKIYFKVICYQNVTAFSEGLTSLLLFL